MKIFGLIAAVLACCCLSACFGRGEVRESCDKPRPYQNETLGKRIESPDGLDPLDEFKEIPIPEAQTELQPEPGKCIESPPPIRASDEN